jgi:hypothetical protein
MRSVEVDVVPPTVAVPPVALAPPDADVPPVVLATPDPALTSPLQAKLKAKETKRSGLGK